MLLRQNFGMTTGANTMNQFNLKLSKDGTDVLKLSPSGELTVEGNVTAFGSA